MKVGELRTKFSTGSWISFVRNVYYEKLFPAPVELIPGLNECRLHCSLLIQVVSVDVPGQMVLADGNGFEWTEGTVQGVSENV